MDPTVMAGVQQALARSQLFWWERVSFAECCQKEEVFGCWPVWGHHLCTCVKSNYQHFDISLLLLLSWHGLNIQLRKVSRRTGWKRSFNLKVKILSYKCENAGKVTAFLLSRNHARNVPWVWMVSKCPRPWDSRWTVIPAGPGLGALSGVLTSAWLLQGGCCLPGKQRAAPAFAHRLWNRSDSCLHPNSSSYLSSCK